MTIIKLIHEGRNKVERKRTKGTITTDDYPKAQNVIIHRYNSGLYVFIYP